MAGEIKRRSAAGTIWHWAGWFNEHWGRLKVVAVVLGALAAGCLFGGGLIVQRYGWVGGSAMALGALFGVASLTAFLVERHHTRRIGSANDQMNALLRREYKQVKRQRKQPPELLPITLMPGAVDDGSERASDDERVLVRYTERQSGPVKVRLRYDESGANERGEIELRAGHARRVRLYVDLTNELPADIERAHVTILFPDTLITYAVPETEAKFRADRTAERMVSDSEGSLRLRAFVRPLVGRGNVNEIPIILDVGFAREIPIRVIVSANELPEDVSFYGAIVGVDGPHAIAAKLLDEFTALIAAEWEGHAELSTGSGSGDVDAANGLLKKARPILAKYYADEMYRLSPDIPENASSKYVESVLSNALPAIHNFKNKYEVT